MAKNANGTIQTYSYEFGVDELVTKSSVGAQDPVLLHDVIPEGWEVFDVDLEVTTAFNGTDEGDHTLDVGTSDNGDAIIDGTVVTTAGIKSPTVVRYRSTASTQLTLTLITADDNPTAGALRVTLLLIHVAKEA